MKNITVQFCSSIYFFNPCQDRNMEQRRQILSNFSLNPQILVLRVETLGNLSKRNDFEWSSRDFNPVENLSTSLCQEADKFIWMKLSRIRVLLWKDPCCGKNHHGFLHQWIWTFIYNSSEAHAHVGEPSMQFRPAVYYNTHTHTHVVWERAASRLWSPASHRSREGSCRLMVRHKPNMFLIDSADESKSLLLLVTWQHRGWNILLLIEE